MLSLFLSVISFLNVAPQKESGSDAEIILAVLDVCGNNDISMGDLLYAIAPFYAVFIFLSEVCCFSESSAFFYRMPCAYVLEKPPSD